jgi:hypothetical protein
MIAAFKSAATISDEIIRTLHPRLFRALCSLLIVMDATAVSVAA